MDIIKKIAEELSVKTSQVDAAVKLIDEGCTIPFIARYRKEVMTCQYLKMKLGEHFM